MELLRSFEVFCTGALGYGVIELAFRGHTHITMGILGGICFLFISILNKYRKDFKRGLILSVCSALFITAAEAAMGYFLNIKMGLNIWSYSETPFNLAGQICLRFSLAWVAVSYGAMIVSGINDKYVLCINEESENFAQST